MVDLAQGFRPRNELVYSDPRSHIYIEDAKTFFSSNNKKYDIIISEPSNPWVSGVSGLFTNEFYKLIKRHLKHDGLFVQWIQLYEIDIELVASILKALSTNFDGDMLVVAKRDGELSKLNNRLFTDQHLASSLHKIDIYNLQDISLRKIGNRSMYLPLLDDYSIAMNSDYNPVLDQNAARVRFTNKDAIDLIALTREPLPALELLGVRQPDWAHSKFTVTDHFKLSKAAYRATIMRDYLIGARLAFSPVNDSLALKREADELKHLMLDCIAPRNGDKIYVLLSAALKLTPYLRPSELKLIWSPFESGPCLRNWNPTEILWFDFILAMNDRNANKISILSSQLLVGSQDLTPPIKKYLVAASMLANFSLDNAQRANQIWSKYKEELFGQEKAKLLFRLLGLRSNYLKSNKGHSK